MTANNNHPASRRELWVVLAILWLCGVALRLTILAVPPVIIAIQRELDLSGTAVGVLSALPVILFALFALPGSLLIARLGVAATLVAGLLIGAVGAALRGALPSIWALYAATVIMGAGIAMMQVALPAAVREWTPDRVGFATALYTNGLLIGEILPVALTIPWLLPLVGGSWRWSLALWALPSLAIAVVTLRLAPRPAAKPQGRAETPARWWPVWNDPLLWKLALIFSSITATYFGANAFLPAHLASAGRPDLIPAGLTALNLGQLPVSFLLLAVATRLERRAWPLVLMGLVALFCVAGMGATASVWTVVFAAGLGGILAGALTLALALPALLSAPANVARLSAGMFTVSYTLAVMISVVSGAAWDLSGAPAFAFLPIALGTLPLILLTPTIPFRRRQAEEQA
jgi:CP family cyanate transporter-like MFS transporter